MFHHLHGGEHPEVQGSWAVKDLARVIESTQGLLSAGDFYRRALTGMLEPHHRCLTFDDGLRCQWDLARPVLQAFNLTAFFFIPTAPLIGVPARLEWWRWIRTTRYEDVEQFYKTFFDTWVMEFHGGALYMAPLDYLAEHTYLTQSDRDFRYWRDEVLGPTRYAKVMEAIAAGHPAPPRLHMNMVEVATLRREGHLIGTHSHSHPTTLAALPHEAQEIEYMTSTWIMERQGWSPDCVSHPCNQVSQHGLNVLKGLGYKLGFMATPKAGDSVLELGRIDAADLR